jgi:hypothetical protein
MKFKKIFPRHYVFIMALWLLPFLIRTSTKLATGRYFIFRDEEFKKVRLMAISALIYFRNVKRGYYGYSDSTVASEYTEEFYMQVIEEYKSRKRRMVFA